MACTASTPAPGTPSAPAAPTALAADRIQLLHTNDIHGKLEPTLVPSGGGRTFEQGGMAALASWVNVMRRRAPDRTLLVDGGDAWQGTFTSNANKGQAVVQAMNLMGYDAQALGNHDFDWGQDVLIQRAKEAKFPFLAANLEAPMSGVGAWVRPYITKTVGGARVAIVGATNPRSATIVKASSIEGLAFKPLDALAPTIRALRPAVDLLVVVSHAGLELDTELAQQAEGIDILISAHDHVALRTARTVGSTRIFETGAYTDNLGRIEITLDPATHRPTAIQGADVLLPIASGVVKPDPDVAKIVNARKAEGAAVTSRVIGRAAVMLEGTRGTEIPLGNLITDALLDYGRKQGWQTDVAFYNQGGVRASLPAGDITFGKLYEVLPFANTIVSVDLTGAQLKEVLEGAAGNAGRLHIAGGAFTYRFNNAPSERVIAAEVGGKPLDAARVYHVVTIDYLYTGGDGHTGFKNGTNVKVGDVEVDAVAAYISAHSPIDPKIEGRIVAQ